MDHLAGDISRQYACHGVLRAPDTPNGLGGVGVVVWLVKLQICLQMFTPKIGEDEPNLTNIFSNGLVQPPTSCVCCFFGWEKKVKKKHTVPPETSSLPPESGWLE